MSYLGKVDMNDANIKHYSLTGSTLTTVDIGWVPPSEQSLRVTINGVVQQGGTFSISGSNLTLGGALIATDDLEVVGIQSVGNIVTPADSSVTLTKMASGTDGNLITYDASGNPAHVATGTATHVLTSNGAGAAPTFQAPAAGGLTHASQWRLTTGFQGDASPIASNLEEVDAPVGFGVLGASMTESSGIFTFPTTGYWLITFHASFSCDGDNQWLMAFIYTTTNDLTYAKAAEGNCPSFGASTATNYPSTDASYIFDVTNTSTHKCAFYIDVQTATDDTEGNTDRNKTYMTFLRLADT